MKNEIFFFVISLLPLCVLAQEPVKADRPGEAFSADVVPVNLFQLEAGFRKEHDNNGGGRTNTFLYPSTLLKYGLVKKLELRLLVQDEGDYEYTPKKHRLAAGVDPVIVGAKYNFTKGKNLLPQVSLIVSTSIPHWASPDFKGNFYAPLVRLAMSNGITKKLSLGYNLGEEWADDDVHGKFFFSIAPQYAITEKLGVYAELYGYASKANVAENGVDAGVAWLVLPNVQLDISGGLGLSANAADNFIDLGFSIRLPK